MEKFPQIFGTDHETYYSKSMKTRKSQVFEIQGVLTDKWYNIQVYPSAKGISVYWQDITRSKQAEGKLSKARQRLNAHIDNFPLSVIEFDP